MTVRQQIPWAEPRYWGNEERYALDALRSSWISGGPYVERLEADLAAHIGSPHVVATSNGTTAIHAAYLALGVQPGDEIVVPGFAFMAAANIALHMGAVPVFADVDPNTWCLTADAVARVFTSRTKGIVAVHTYGNVCDMQSLVDFAEAKGVWLIEDAAEAFGSTYRGQQAGSVAEIGTFSFHATKTITTGEGGGVVTKQAGLCEHMRLYRSHGVHSRRYWHEVAGHNFRLTNLQAAIGCAQLENIEAVYSERRRIYREYSKALLGLESVYLQTIAPEIEPIVWAVAVRLQPDAFPQGRDHLMMQLGQSGIETRPGFYSASEMRHLYNAPTLPSSTMLAQHVISLPSSPTVSDEEVAFIVSRLAKLSR